MLYLATLMELPPAHDVAADPSELTLRDPQRGEQRGLTRRIMGQHLAIFRERGLGELYLNAVRHGRLYYSTLRSQMVPCAEF
jgi:hypothetical protein